MQALSRFRVHAGPFSLAESMWRADCLTDEEVVKHCKIPSELRPWHGGPAAISAAFCHCYGRFILLLPGIPRLHPLASDCFHAALMEGG